MMRIQVRRAPRYGVYGHSLGMDSLTGGAVSTGILQPCVWGPEVCECGYILRPAIG